MLLNNWLNRVRSSLHSNRRRRRFRRRPLKADRFPPLVEALEERVMLSVQTVVDDDPGAGNPAVGDVDPTAIDLHLLPAEQAIETVTLTFPAGEEQIPTADIVFIVDESGSMGTEQAWIVEMAQELEDSLEQQGINDSRFALVGYLGEGTLFNMAPSEVHVSIYDAGGTLVDQADVPTSYEDNSSGNGAFIQAEFNLPGDGVFYAVVTNDLLDDQALISIDAENYHAAATGIAGDSWTEIDDFSASGTHLMEAGPDDGTYYSSSTLSDAPRLDYDVDFAETGNYTVWFRGQQPDSSGNKVYFGHASDEVSRNSFGGFEGALSWEKGSGTLTISSTGEQTLSLWMGEDGVKIDKIVLTKDSSYTPTGTGPSQSLQASSTDPFQQNTSSLEYSFFVQDDSAAVTGAALTLNDVAGNAISPNGADHDYSFTLAGTTDLLFESLTANTQYNWTLTGPGGDVVTGRGFDQSDLLLAATAAGSYSLTVQATDNVRGAYGFRLLDLTNATSLTTGSSTNSTLGPVTESNVYALSVTVGNQYYFDAESWDGDSNARWRLVDDAGSVLFDASLDEDRDLITAAGTGTYWLVVEGDPAESAGTARTFSFTVEDVGTEAAATGSLTLGTTVSDSLSQVGKRQHHTFTLSAETLLYFDSLTDSNSLHWMLTGSAGDVVSARELTAGNAGLLLAADDYTLSIDGSGEATGSYSFDLFDVSAAATTLTPDTTVNGTLDPAGETHIYTFSVTAGDKYSFDSQSWNGSSAARWKLVDPFGNVLLDESLADDHATMLLHAGGTYTLLIEGDEAETGTPAYTFLVTDEGSDTSDPAPLTLGQVTSGDISASAEQDQYTFTLAAAGLFYFDALTDRGPVRWSLSDSGGAVVTDRAFAASNAAGVADADAVLSLSADTYTLTIDADTGITGDYAFQLIDLATEASSLTAGSPTATTLEAHETQVYSITATSGDRLHLSLADWEGSANARWRLVDEGGSVLATDDLSTGIGSVVLAAGGTVYLLLEGDLAESVIAREATVKVDLEAVASSGTLTLGQLTSGTVTSAGDLLEYTFTGTAGQQVLLDFSSGAGSDHFIRLRGPRGDVLFDVNYDSTNVANQITSVVLGNAGAYQLIVGADNSSTGDFEFQLTVRDDLSLNDDVSGTLETITGREVYQFSGVGGQTVQIRLDVWGNAADLSFAASRLSTDGGTEDGYNAIDVALELLDLRDAASKHIVLITDEDRDIVNSSLSAGGIETAMTNAEAKLHAVLDMQIDTTDQTPLALGVDGDGTDGMAFFADGSGDYTTETTGGVDFNRYGVAGDYEYDRNVGTEVDYVDPTNALEGTLWDLEQLRSGGVQGTSFANALSFSRAFVAVLTAQIEEDFEYDLVSSDPNVTFEILSETLSETDVTYDVRFTGDGSAYVFDLEFEHENDPGVAVGSIPVTITTSYIRLTEETDFNTHYEDPFTITGTTAAVSFKFSDLQFDTADSDSINDAFELALVDDSGNTLVGTITAGRDAFFNITEGEAADFGAGVDYDVATGVVTVDVTHLADGTAATLIARLVNNDSDSTTTVTVAPSGTLLTASPVSDPSTTTPAVLSEIRQTIDFAQLSDVSSGMAFDYTQTSFAELNDLLFAKLSVTNSGTFPVQGPLLLTVGYISEPKVLVRGFDGVTPDGVPYYDISHLAAGDGLAPLETAAGALVQFFNPNHLQFDVALQLLGHVNAGPQFTSEPLVETVAGAAYTYDAEATDPEGDLLTYSLVSGPDDLSIDAATGTVTWTTASSDAGTHPVVIRATDPQGASDEQSFLLTVLADVANRPPVFTSIPLVDTYVNLTYVYQAAAFDPDGDALSYSVVSGPAGLTIADPAVGQVSWAPPASLVDQLVSVSLKVEDGQGDEAIQNYMIYVHPELGNHDPIIISTPDLQYELPGLTGNVAVGNVDPDAIALNLLPGETTTETVSLTFPDESIFTTDILLVVDESGSMIDEHTWIRGMLEDLEVSLEAAGVMDSRFAMVSFTEDLTRILLPTRPSRRISLFGPDNELLKSIYVPMELWESPPEDPDLADWTPEELLLDDFILPTDGEYVVVVHDDGSAAPEFEYNFVMEDYSDTVAVAYQMNSAINTVVASPDKRHKYTFTLAAPSRLYFDSLSVSPNVDWTLVGPNGIEFEEQPFDSSDFFFDAAAGEYTLWIDLDWAIDSQGYTFRLTDLDSSATALTPSTTVNGTLSPADETNVYQFTATGEYTFDFLNQSWSGANDGRWQLLDPSGTVLFDDVITTDQIDVTLAAAGTYTLLIEGDVHDPNPSQTYEFDVLVNVPTATTSGNSSMNEGATYTLNLGAEHFVPTAWEIDWGDGTSVQTFAGNPSNVTHVFADGDANWTIDATAKEGTEEHLATPLAVTVSIVAPTLSLGGSSSVILNDTYTLLLSSSDPGADTISQWDVDWGDGSSVETVSGNPSSATHDYSTADSYTISATATDEDGTFNANTLPVTVHSDQSPFTGTALTLDQTTNGDFSSATSVDYIFTLNDTTTVSFDILSNHFAGTQQSQSDSASASPGTVVASGGSIYGWSTPGNATASNNTYAKVVGPNEEEGFSQNLDLTNFNFSIPTGATIDGITVQVEGRAQQDYHEVSDVILLKGGAAHGADKGTNGEDFSYTADSTLTFGGAADLWAGSWTDTDINAGNFGVRLAFHLGDDDDEESGEVWIDHVQVTIDYSEITTTPDDATEWTLISSDNTAIVSDLSFLDTDGVGAATAAYSLAPDHYKLTVANTAASPPSYSVRLLDVATAATTFTPDTTVNGSLVPATETDVYQFSANAGEKYNFDAITGGAELGWRLVDPSGNELFASGLDADHNNVTLSETGSHTVLVEGDVQDESASKSYSFNVVSLSATSSGSGAVDEAASYTLNLSATVITPTSWDIDWGDGTAVETVSGNPSSVTHVFADGVSNYTVNATANSATDSYAADPHAVTVSNVAPTLTIGGDATVVEGATYTLSLSASDPGTDTISQWDIDWGDGSAVETVSGNPSSATHVYSTPASNTISATATDEDGTFNANTLPVTVESDQSPFTGTTLTLDQTTNGDFSSSTSVDYIFTLTDTTIVSFDVLSNHFAGTQQTQADSATSSPGTVASTGGGLYGWTTPSNATASNNTYAKVVGPDEEEELSQNLDLTNFNLSIPTSATIDGITVQVEGRARQDYHEVSDVILLKGGSTYGADKGTHGEDFSYTADTTLTFGGAADLWAGSWTDTDVNATNFGVRLRFALGDDDEEETGEVWIDHVQITIDYTATVTGPDDATEWTLISSDTTEIVSDHRFLDTDGVGAATAAYSLAPDHYKLTVANTAASPPFYSFRLLDVVTAGTLFTPGTTQSSDLDPATETDVYQFSANVGETYNFDALTGDASVGWRLLDPSGGELFASGLDTDHNGVTLNQTGDFTILVEGDVEDESTSQSYSFDVLLVSAPTAFATGSGVENEGTTYTLNLSMSVVTPTSWDIDWGDSSGVETVAGNPSSVTHVFADGDSNYTVNATANSATDSYAADPHAVTISNVAPSLTISGNSTASEAATYILSLSSSDPGDDTISQWDVDWGDGSAVETVPGNPSSVTHVYSTTASYTISATATDEDGTVNANSIAVNVVTATAMALNSTVSGTLTANSADVYSFTLGGPARLYFDWLDTQSTAVDVLVEDANGNTVLTSTFADENVPDSIAPLVFSQAGTYYVLIGEYTAATWNYGFRLLDVADQPELQFNRLTTREVPQEAAHDVIRFTGVAGQRLVLSNSAWGGAQSIAEAGDLLTTYGDDEDGYAALELALSKLEFRENVSRNVILITDEARTAVGPPYVTLNDVLAKFDETDTVWHSVLNLNLEAGTPSTAALGLDGLGAGDTTYYPDGNGGYTSGPSDNVTMWGGDPNTKASHLDYGSPSLDEGGTLWDLYQLAVGGLIAESFSNAFTDIITADIDAQLEVDLLPSVAGIDFEIINTVVTTTSVSFDVEFTGDGLPQCFDLQFVRKENPGIVLGSIPVTMETDYVYDVNAIDPDQDPLSYTLVGETHGAVFDNATGLLLWEPTGVGDYEFTAMATDGRGGQDLQTWTVTVTSGGTNTDPSLQAAGPFTLETDRPFSTTLAASDADGDGVMYQLLDDPAGGMPLPTGMTIDTLTGVVSWTPAENQVGSHDVTARAVDGRGGLDTVTITFDVQQAVGFQNTRPVIVSVAPTTTDAGDLYSYDVDATDADGDLLVYQLSLAPAGMAIDLATGLIAWQPTSAQIGHHSVIVRANDQQGGTAVQFYDLEVLTGNEAPAITSTSALTTEINTLYNYQVTATDPNAGDTLSYALVAGPAGMTMDAAGLVSWTPTTAEVVSVTVSVSDQLGATTTQTYNLGAIDLAVNNPPVILSTPRDRIQMDQRFLHQVVGFDPDGDGLTYSLVSGPTGMTMDAAGLISWTPTGSDVNNPASPHAYTVRVEDDRTAFVEETYNLDVVEVRVNSAPAITSVPPTTATRNVSYSYAAAATDADNDLLAWSLLDGPAGMTVDVGSGLVSWTPTANDVGVASVLLQVADSFGGAATQTFGITVSGANLGPMITSTPVTEADLNVAYSYQAAAYDPDGETLTYVLTSFPAGMTVDTGTGLIDWTPGATGTVPVTLLVADSDNATVEQSFSVVVTDPATLNHAPVIESVPVFQGLVDQAYSYQLVASDADADTLTYAVDSGPTGLTIDTGTGLVSWTPTSGQAGPHPVVLSVTDGVDTVIHWYTVEARANAAPVIQSISDTQLTAGKTFSLPVWASDADGDELVYTLDTFPAGMTIDAVGRIVWSTTAAEVGAHTVDVTVTDEWGATASDSFVLTVTADTAAPLVVLLVSANPAHLNSTLTILVLAADDVGVESLSLTVDGTPVLLDGAGRATLDIDSLTSRALVATATDAAGNSGTDSLTLTVIDPSDVNDPVVSFSSPADEAEITSPTDVVGSVTDPDSNLVSWSLTLNGLSADDLLIGSGAAEVSSGLLGSIDPTILANGVYELELSALDAGGNTASVTQEVLVTGDLKLGNFSLSFVDLQIPVAGFPITVSRTYNTLLAGRQEDFGYGWTLDVDNTAVAVTHDYAASGDLSGFGGYVPFRDGTRVVVTMPDGSTEGFTFQGVPGEQFASIILYWLPTFVPDPGVTSELITSSTPLSKVGEEYVDYTTGLAYNPERFEFGNAYQLDLRSGVSLAINATTGELASITDRNGNSLTFTGDGIVSSNGRGVEFLRDFAGRITAVVDPAGNEITYSYDAEGDLVSVTDRIAGTTQFSYLASPAHYLDEITDPLGNPAARTEYDAEGRIKKIIDADGQTIEYSFNSGTLIQTVTDQLGFVTTLTVDDRGNVLSAQDHLGGETLRTYNADDLVLSETTVVGLVDDAQNGETDDITVGYTYDTFENLLTATDELGNATYYTYNEAGQQLTVTDPLGNTERIVYTANGNLRRTIDPLGNSVVILYDSHGLPSTTTDSLGNSSSYTFNSFGDVTSRVDPLANTTTFSYDVYGNQTGSSFSWVNPLDPADVRVVATTTDYDDNDRATRTVDGKGNETLTGYNAAGQVVSTTDIFGETTNFLYDARGQLIETAYPDGTRTRTVYDGKGRAIYRDDRHPFGSSTNGSHTIYDALDRDTTTERLADVVIDLVNTAGVYSSVLTSTGALLTTTSTTYDSAGRMTTSTNTHGHVTSYEYDDFGQQTAVEQTINATTLRTEYEYDDFGRTVLVRDPYARETQSVYDAFGRQTKTIHHDGRSNSNTYDSFGRTLTLLSMDGVLTSYEFDSFGRQSAVDVTADGNTTRTEFEFDVYGNRSLVRDALGHETSYEFDQFGRSTATIFDDGSRAEVTFDSFGNVVTETNPLGLIKSYEYDSEGQLTAVVLPAVTDPGTSQSANPRYEYEYDTRGNQTLIRDPEGHETSFTYDDFGRQTSRTLPTGETETFSYDARGRQTVHVDFAGRVIETIFDDTATGRGKVGEQRFFDDLTAYDNGNGTPTETVTYTYDDLGRMTTVVDPRGTTTYTYNDDRLITKIDSPEGIIRYEYEPVTNRRTRTYTTDATGEVINDFRYTYDSLGRLKTVTVDERNDVALVTPEVTSYDYDDVGNLDKVFLPNGIVSDYEYDNLNRVDKLTHYEPDATPEDLSDNTKLAEYDYDVAADGRRTGVTETRYDSGSAETTRIDWTYDDLGRLTDEVFNHYDDLLDQTLHFTYDLSGNRLEQTLDKGNDATIDEKVTYTFDDNDRMLTESLDSDNDGTVDTTTTYGYTATEQTSKTVVDEATSNTTSQTDYEYGLDGRMKKVTIETYDGTGTLTRKEVTTYDYDPTGIRVSALHEVDSDGDGTWDTRTNTTYLVDHRNFTGHQQVLEEVVTDADTGAEIKRVVYTLGHDVVAQTTFTPGGPAEGDTLVLLYDAHGSTRFVADMVAQIVEAYAYDAYGNAIGFNAAAALTTLLYSGEQFDSRIGQQYLRARYYNSATGTFNRLDPFAGNIRDPQSLHKYLYTHADPINGIDPTGESAIHAVFWALDAASVYIEGITAGFSALNSDVDPIAGLKYGLLISAATNAGFALAFKLIAPWGPSLLRLARASSNFWTSLFRLAPWFKTASFQNAFSNGKAALKHVGEWIPGARFFGTEMTPRVSDLTDDVIENFTGNNVTPGALANDTIMYHVWGGETGRAGSWVTRDLPATQADAINDLALKPVWGNTASFVSEVHVPKGTPIYEGTAKAQGPGLDGGGNQVYIPTEWRLDHWFKSPSPLN